MLISSTWKKICLWLARFLLDSTWRLKKIPFAKKSILVCVCVCVCVFILSKLEKMISVVYVEKIN